MTRPFVRERKVRFAHVDGAGIVFYPRYFEMLDAVVEDWTEDRLGLTRQALHLERGLGLPAVSLETAFCRASRLSDVLRFVLTTRHVGNASATLDVTAGCAGEARLTGVLKLVLVTLDPLAACPWPRAWRQALLDLES